MPRSPDEIREKLDEWMIEQYYRDRPSKNIERTDGIAEITYDMKIDKNEIEES